MKRQRNASRVRGFFAQLRIAAMHPHPPAFVRASAGDLFPQAGRGKPIPLTLLLATILGQFLRLAHAPFLRLLIGAGG